LEVCGLVVALGAKAQSEVRAMAPPPLPLRPWGFLALAGVSFVAGKLAPLLVFAATDTTAVWPPTGVALAAMLLWGYRVWPALLLGAVLAAATTVGLVWTALGIALGHMLEALLGAFLVTQLANGRNTFDRVRDIVKFTVLAGLMSATVGATVGVLSLTLGDHAGWHLFAAVWLTWWLGDAAGAVVIAPFLVLWGRDRRVRLTPATALELASVFGAVVLVGCAVFNGLLSPWMRNGPLTFLCLPALVLAAFRLGQREAATSMAVLSGLAVWGTVHGSGPFVRGSAIQSLLVLDAFMLTLVMMTLPLAAVVRGHARAEASLASGAAIVASSDDAILGKTLDGILTSWNAGAKRLYGYSAREAIGQPISMLIPPERVDELPKILARLARGEHVDPYETVRRTKERRLLDVSITVSPTLDASGRIFGASSIERDITPQKEIEAANRERDALRSVASLAAAAAHEINNPLAVVVGQAQLLDDAVDPSGRRRIAEILEAAQRIEAIVARMKRITRIELMQKSVDLPETLDIRKSSEPGAGDD
jgi:PAS domain S-box-containing protein